jgi:hypothetical protein
LGNGARQIVTTVGADKRDLGVADAEKTASRAVSRSLSSAGVMEFPPQGT